MVVHDELHNAGVGVGAGDEPGVAVGVGPGVPDGVGDGEVPGVDEGTGDGVAKDSVKDTIHAGTGLPPIA